MNSCGFDTTMLEEELASIAYCLCRFCWALYSDESALKGVIIVFL